jgi:hypothetical protein
LTADVNLGVTCSKPKDRSPGNGRSDENLIEQKLLTNGSAGASITPPRKQDPMKRSLFT